MNSWYWNSSMDSLIRTPSEWRRVNLNRTDFSPKVSAVLDFPDSSFESTTVLEMSAGDFLWKLWDSVLHSIWWWFLSTMTSSSLWAQCRRFLVGIWHCLQLWSPPLSSRCWLGRPHKSICSRRLGLSRSTWTRIGGTLSSSDEAVIFVLLIHPHHMRIH